MLSPSHLHFRTMSPEARQSALHRLAWRGFDPRTISEQTGLPEFEVRRAIESDAGVGGVPQRRSARLWLSAASSKSIQAR